MFEWASSREHFVGNHAEGVDVTLRANSLDLAKRLFWAHVARRADDLPMVSLFSGRTQHFGNPEIHQLEPRWRATDHEYVARLEISVDDADGVGCGKSRADLPQEINDLLVREALLGAHQSCEVEAV